MKEIEFEPIEIEDKGYRKGINPFFGEFERTFNIPPIPYGNPKKKEFVNLVHKELSDIKYLLTSEVRITIILYLNERVRYETHQSADLDNYAKLICDAIKGPEGIIIDDVQIQYLSVSWIDTTKEESFELNILTHPDSFLPKPIKLFEMPNELYYPVPEKMWTKEGIIDLNEADVKFLLEKLFHLTKSFRDKKHRLRLEGFNPDNSYYGSIKQLPCNFIGIHKSRAMESGFDIVQMDQWLKNIDIL